MLKSIRLAALIALLAVPAFADSGIRRTPCGYQQIAVLSAASSLTVPSCGTGGPVTMATITPEGQAVRYRDDGTAPTASVGQPMAVGAILIYEGSIAKIQFIEQVSGAKLNISYYR